MLCLLLCHCPFSVKWSQTFKLLHLLTTLLMFSITSNINITSSEQVLTDRFNFSEVKESHWVSWGFEDNNVFFFQSVNRKLLLTKELKTLLCFLNLEGPITKIVSWIKTHLLIKISLIILIKIIITIILISVMSPLKLILKTTQQSFTSGSDNLLSCVELEAVTDLFGYNTSVQHDDV